MSIDELNNMIADAIKKEGYSTRGMKVRGVVVSTRMKKTATIEREITKYIPKYKRWAADKSKIHIHVPEGIELKVGDVVEAMQTRKISKTKTWILTRILKRGG